MLKLNVQQIHGHNKRLHGGYNIVFYYFAIHNLVGGVEALSVDDSHLFDESTLSTLSRSWNI